MEPNGTTAPVCDTCQLPHVDASNDAVLERMDRHAWAEPSWFYLNRRLYLDAAHDPYALRNGGCWIAQLVVGGDGSIGSLLVGHCDGPEVASLSPEAA